MAEHQLRDIREHFAAYLAHLKARGTAETHQRSVERRLERLAADCDFKHLKDISRSQVEQWLLALSDDGLAAASRVHILIHTRAYLHWLDERRELRVDPDDLVRCSDMPKLPTYLPRDAERHRGSRYDQRGESKTTACR